VTRLGLALPFFPALPLPEYQALAREAEARGYRTAWTGEVTGTDAFTPLALVASVTSRLGLATGIVPIQTRTPIVLALTAATLAYAAPGRVALGLGISSRIIVGDWHGLPFSRSLQQMREAVRIIRAVLAGERVNFDGAFYCVRNFRMTTPPPAPPVPIYLAALGREMTELAGEIADGVLLNWIAPETIPASVKHLETGARRAGRTLADFEIAAYIRTTVTDAPAPVRQALAREITGYAIVDSYARFFADGGFAAEVEAVQAAWKAGDRAGAVGRISPRLLDALGVVGPADFCRQRLAEFARAGLTMPVVFPFVTGPEPGEAVLRTVRAFP